VRAVGLHPDVVVVTSRLYQTTCTLVRSGGEAFCIDSPILPDELEILPTVAEQARFTVVGLLATHADWDHLLGAYAFPEAALGVSESTAAVLRDQPGAAQRALRGFDEEHYVVRPRPLGIGEVQPLPTPGRCGLGESELELHPTAGHTADGLAVRIPWADIVVCGDYLSPVEIPMISPGGSVDAYVATLDILEPLVADATAVVPGHGEPLDGPRALAILREDRAYLGQLRDRGIDAKLPLARRSREQKRIHADNVKAVQAGAPPQRAGGRS
jgi:glyoxylase-like metal-dependent hydrolase (beta-lactamase superfamily II)